MRRIIYVIMCLVCIMPAIAENPVGGFTRVMVISDPHLLTDENAEALSFNKGGKLDKTSPTIFAKAVETIVQAKPEALLVCGDMTFNGEASGHAQAVEAFKTIEAEGIPVLVIPGNHDILNPFSEDVSGKNVTAKQFKTLYAAFGMGKDSDLENISRDAKSLSWAASLKGTDLAIIGLDANIYNEDAEFYSDGCIRKSTVDWMKTQAKALRSKGKMVVCMVHQQLVEHVPGQSVLAQSTLLNIKHTKNPVDGDDEEDVTLADLQKAFADAQIKYVLTGHFHIHHTQDKTIKNSAGDDFTLTELTTGGLSTYPNWSRTLVFDTKNGKLESSTSTMIQTKVGEYDLQSLSKAELTAWAGDSYGSIVAAVIVKMNGTVDKYEVYDGTTQFQMEEGAYPEVHYTRYFNNKNWQPLYVPFDMRFADWSSCFEVAVFQSASADSVNFKLLAEGEMLEKNTPALVRLKGGLPTGRYTITSSIKTSDMTTVMPVGGVCSSQSDLTFYGTYERLTADNMLLNGSYYLSEEGLKSVDANEDFSLLPQRWFMASSGNADSGFNLYTSVSLVAATDNFELKNKKYFIDGRLVIVRNNKVYNAKGQEMK